MHAPLIDWCIHSLPNKKRIALLVVFAVVHIPTVAFAQDTSQSFMCYLFGFLVRPFGMCELVESNVIQIPESPAEFDRTPTSERVVETEPALEKESNTQSQTTERTVPAAPPTTITQIIQGLSEGDIRRIVEERIRTLRRAEPLVVTESGVVTEEDLQRLERKIGSIDSVSRANTDNTRSDISEQISDIQTNGTITDLTLTGDTTLSGLTGNSVLYADSSGTLSSASNVTFLEGKLGIGTTSPSEVFSLNGAMYLAPSSPASTANRLYNVGGDLYWNGNIMSSSSAGAWTAASGDVYRLTGNVGIGSSSPSAMLTVSGDAIIGTTTSVLLDQGGRVCNVKAYGAVGDDATDNYAAIMDAITDCSGAGIVYFPPGIYRISQTIVLDRPVTFEGSFASRWSYSNDGSDDHEIRSSIKPTTPFTGSAIVHIRDRSISGESLHNNGGRFHNIMIDGNSYGTNVHGLYFEGLVRDWKITDVDISQTSGNGFLSEVGSGSGNPRGFTIQNLSIYSAAGHGFRATALNDSYLEDILTVANALRGFYFSSIGETKINNSRAVFNALEGLYIDGHSNNGGMQFTDFSTDRNVRHGVRISASGTTTISFNGLLTRRDGNNSNGGTETPYAGVAIIGSSSDPAAPVIIQNLTQISGVDDGGGGTPSPDVGVRVEDARYVKVDGVLWGNSQAYLEGTGVETFIIEEETMLKTGFASVTESLYQRKWIATSSNLVFTTGKVGIGTTSPTSKLHVVNDDTSATVLTLTGTTSQTADYLRIKSDATQSVGDVLTLSSAGYLGIGTSTTPRLFSIAGDTNVGARFTDTDNNTRFDLRVEDFQAFIGTQSNHDVRFITNGTSKMTIDTAGDVGIGTTSPLAKLDVWGDVSFTGLTTAGVSGNALCLAADNELVVNTGAQTCTVSSQRFKNSIFELTPEKSAEIAALLEPKTFKYNGTDEERIGLIAEEVEQVDDRLIFREYNGAPRGVRYEDIVAVVLGALQHQQQQITALMGGVAEGVQLVFDSIFAKTIVVENATVQNLTVEEDVEVGGQLCVDGVCVTGSQLRVLLEQADLVPEILTDEEGNEELLVETKQGSTTEESTEETTEESAEEPEQEEIMEESKIETEELEIEEGIPEEIEEPETQ